MLVSDKFDKYLLFCLFILLAAFVAMPQLKYYALHTGVADFGFFLAGIYKVNEQWPHIFYGHVQPYMYLYGLLFQVMPGDLVPYALLSLQSFFLVGSILIMWKSYGNLAGISLLLYPPIWANNLFDFHFDHIAIPLLAIFFSACKSKKYFLASIAAVLLCFVKEIFALQAIACGIYLAVLSWRDPGCCKKKWVFFSPFLITSFASLWFYLAIKFFLPYFSDVGKTALESGAFSWMGKDIGQIFSTLVFHMDKVVIDILTTPKKIYYLIYLFGPFILIPFLRPLPLIVAAPILMVSMLSHQSNYYDYAAHYSAGLIIPIVVAYVEGVTFLRKYFFNIKFGEGLRLCNCNIDLFNLFLIFWLTCFQVLLGSSPISRLFWSDKIWSINYNAYISSSRDASIRNAIRKYVPIDDEIIISSQNNLNYLDLAKRQNYLIFPGGVVEPHQLTNWDHKTFHGFLGFVKEGDIKSAIQQELVYADYVLIDIHRPYFVYDAGCDTIYSKCTNRHVEALYLDSLKTLESKYTLLYEYDGFRIYKKP